MTDGKGLAPVLTSGTGFAARNLTPEAHRALLKRPAPGLVLALVSAGLARTPCGGG